MFFRVWLRRLEGLYQKWLAKAASQHLHRHLEGDAKYGLEQWLNAHQHVRRHHRLLFSLLLFTGIMGILWVTTIFEMDWERSGEGRSPVEEPEKVHGEVADGVPDEGQPTPTAVVSVPEPPQDAGRLSASRKAEEAPVSSTEEGRGEVAEEVSSPAEGLGMMGQLEPSVVESPEGLAVVQEERENVGLTESSEGEKIDEGADGPLGIDQMQQLLKRIPERNLKQQERGYVQLGLFRDPIRAQNIMADLGESGYQVKLMERVVEGEILYLLRDYSAKTAQEAHRLKRIYDGWYSLDSIVKY